MATEQVGVQFRNIILHQSDPRVAQRVRSKRQDERNSTSSQRWRQTSSNLVIVRKVMRVGHRQGGGVGGVRQASSLVGSEFLSYSGHTFLISAGEAFRSLASKGTY